MEQRQIKRELNDCPVLLHFRRQTKIPSEYVCPISWRIMSDPVFDPSDSEHRAVERDAFESHVRQYGVRPLTGLPPGAVGTLPTVERAISDFLADATEAEPVSNLSLPLAQPPVAKRPRLSEAQPLSHLPPRPNPPWLVAAVRSCGALAGTTDLSVGVGVGKNDNDAGHCDNDHGDQRRSVLQIVGTEEIPATFFCPLSRVLMLDPAVSCSGEAVVTMERAALAAFVELYGTHPQTGKHMALSDIYPDNTTRRSIARWLAKFCVKSEHLHTAPAQPPAATAGATAAAAGEVNPSGRIASWLLPLRLEAGPGAAPTAGYSGGGNGRRSRGTTAAKVHLPLPAANRYSPYSTVAAGGGRGSGGTPAGARGTPLLPLPAPELPKGNQPVAGAAVSANINHTHTRPPKVQTPGTTPGHMHMPSGGTVFGLGASAHLEQHIPLSQQQQQPPPLRLPSSAPGRSGGVGPDSNSLPEQPAPVPDPLQQSVSEHPGPVLAAAGESSERPPGCAGAGGQREDQDGEGEGGAGRRKVRIKFELHSPAPDHPPLGFISPALAAAAAATVGDGVGGVWGGVGEARVPPRLGATTTAGRGSEGELEHRVGDTGNDTGNGGGSCGIHTGPVDLVSENPCASDDGGGGAIAVAEPMVRDASDSSGRAAGRNGVGRPRATDGNRAGKEAAAAAAAAAAAVVAGDGTVSVPMVTGGAGELPTEGDDGGAAAAAAAVGRLRLGSGAAFPQAVAEITGGPAAAAAAAAAAPTTTRIDIAAAAAAACEGTGAAVRVVVGRGNEGELAAPPPPSATAAEVAEVTSGQLWFAAAEAVGRWAADASPRSGAFPPISPVEAEVGDGGNGDEAAVSDEDDGGEWRLQNAGRSGGREPRSRKRFFSSQELEALVAGVETYGENNWAMLRSCTPLLRGRTESGLHQKWRALVRQMESNWRSGRQKPPSNLQARIAAVRFTSGRMAAVAWKAVAAAAVPSGGSAYMDVDVLDGAKGQSAPLRADEWTGQLVQQGGGGGDGGAGGHAQFPRRRSFKDKWHARLYSHQEVEALVDGVLRHGCDWTAILRDNMVLRNRNQNSIKYKWASLCHGNSNGWESMRAERPSPALCVKLQQAISGLSAKGAQPQVTTTRRYWGDKSAPLVVPNDLVYELYGPHAVREKVKIMVRLNGVLEPTTHYGGLRLIAAHNKYQVVHCPSLRLAAAGRQVVGWERGTE
ncbi:hypothetical protein VaNZ11_006297, partial [Volvox africanus]